MNQGENTTEMAPPCALGKWPFLIAFALACVLFWWLPTILFRLVLNQSDLVHDDTIIVSLIALLLFSMGYLLTPFPYREWSYSERTFEACCGLAFSLTSALCVPSLLASFQFWYSRIGVPYGMSDTIPVPCQILLYTHLFWGMLFLGGVNPKQEGWKRTGIVACEIFVPRLLLSLHSGRFVLAQAVVPIVLIAIARGWVRLTMRRIIQIAALAILVMFIPAVTRGDSIFGQGELADWLAGGSTLKLYQDHVDDDLNGYCSPFLVAFSAKVIPYQQLGSCLIDFGDRKGVPATLDRILAVNTPGSFHGAMGPGSNYLLDLYLFGGFGAVFIGSMLFGISCRQLVSWIGHRSLYVGIWAECLTRALFAPRGNLGYVYERIPSLVATTALVVLIVKAWLIIKAEHLCHLEPATASTTGEIREQ